VQIFEATLVNQASKNFSSFEKFFILLNFLGDAGGQKDNLVGN
jgi:hypothetical protein